MSIRTAGNNTDSDTLQFIRKNFFIAFDLFSVLFEVIRECFTESNRFCCNDMHQRSPLHAWENSLINGFCILFLAHDDAASWSAKCLMCSCRYDICPRNRTWIFAACNQTCKMSHIDHE